MQIQEKKNDLPGYLEIYCSVILCIYKFNLCINRYLLSITYSKMMFV